MRIPAVALGVLLATADPAAAQFTSSLGGTFNNPGSALLGTMIGRDRRRCPAISPQNW
jgi:hypothetical protein